MTVPDSCIVEVCLGPRITNEDKVVVLGAARSLPDKPRIFQAQLTPERFGITFELID